MRSICKLDCYLFFLFLVFVMGCTKDEANREESSNPKMVGETLVLTDLIENSLIKEEISNLKLYSIDNNRNQVYYKENVDYVVSKNRVKRIVNSSIPNFSKHSVVFNIDGTFTFSPLPRNPSLIIPFQVYADYNFKDLESIQGRFDSNLLSFDIKEKLKNKKQLKIATIGTSISAGAHTLEKFYHDNDIQTYPHLIAKAIKTIHGSDCVVTNYSKDGSSIEDIFSMFPAILQEQNDLVFIEFGMNDHISSNWLVRQASFEKKMAELIETFHENKTDVVLVGFFQQNDLWDLEFKGSTRAYNQSISELAKKYSCYFADVNSEFSKYPQSKINQDLCGDFMHHPTSFGHLLYYKTIIPIFLKNDVNDGFVYNLVN